MGMAGECGIECRVAIDYQLAARRSWRIGYVGTLQTATTLSM